MPILDDDYGESEESVIATINANANMYNTATTQATDQIDNAELSVSLSYGVVTVENDGTDGTTKTVAATVMVGNKPKSGVVLKEKFNGSTVGGINPDITFSGASDAQGHVTITISGQQNGANATAGTWHYEIDPQQVIYYQVPSLDVTVTN